MLINPPRLQLDDRTVIFKYTGDGGWFCASFGDGAKYMRAAKEDPVLCRRIEARAQHLRHHRDALGPDLARVMAAVELAKDYDPDQARDEQGRWTREGGAAVAGVVADALSLYGAPNAVAALRALGQRALAAAAALLPEGAAAIAAPVAASAAVLGTLFLPTNRSSVATGTLPDAPEFSYKYDQDTGRLTVTRQNADGTNETVFSGHHDKDAVFRDENGNAIGRFLGDSVALDADAVRGYEARRKSDAGAQAGAVVQSATVARSEPKLCPDPGPDKPGRQDARAIEYQMVVGIRVNGEPLQPGMAIKITGPKGPVYFDDCNLKDGTLIEAKGDKYGQAMRSGRGYPWFGMVGDMMDQAQRQVAAAGGRAIEWHFADPGVADYMRARFAENGLNIGTVYTPPPDWWTEKLARIAKGAWHERSDFADLFA